VQRVDEVRDRRCTAFLTQDFSGKRRFPRKLSKGADQEMMKTTLRNLLLCVLAILCCGAAARMEAQGIAGPTGPTNLNLKNGMPWQLGGSWVFTSGSAATLGFDTRGISYYRILWVPIGTVTSCTLSLDSGTSINPVGGALVSPTIGGIISANTLSSCATAGSYLTPVVGPSGLASATSISAFGQITPTITGSGSVILVVFGYTERPNS